MLGDDHLLDVQATQEYLLTKTQHIIGGFGKLVGDSPGQTSREIFNACKANDHRYSAFVPRSSRAFNDEFSRH